MASPPVMSPGGTTGFNYTKTARTIEAATYQKQIMIPLIEEAERLYGGLTLRKAARVAGAVVAQNSDGTGLTYVNPIGTPVALTPVGNVVPIAWSENEDAQMDQDLDPIAVDSGTSALAELTDQSVLALVPSLTNFFANADVTAAILYQAQGRLMGQTNGMATPGGRPQVYAVFSHKQFQTLATIDIFNNAMVRGDSENPYVQGIWTKGGGLLLKLTTVVANDGNGDHNVVFIPSAFKISWNVRSRIKRQELELQNRVILYNNVGSGIMFDGRAIDIRTTANHA